MNRDEILKKAQIQEDEGLIQAENEGRKLGYRVALGFVYIIVVVVNIVKGNDNSGLLAILWAYLAAEIYPTYKFLHRQSHLWLFGVYTFLSLTSLIIFFINTFR